MKLIICHKKRFVMDSSKFPAWISDFGKETGIEKNHE